MKYTLLVILSFLVIQMAYAQPNMVPNGSFETYSSCPTGLSQTANSTGWAQWTSGTSDYFNTCAGNTVSIPNNTFGYQWPAHGNAYMGCHISVNTSYKEYITRSITTLQIGAAYEVSISISLSNTYGNIAHDDIGVFFFDGGPASISTTALAGVTPQIDYSGNGVFADTQNWMRLTKTFVADSAYDNIAIGGFKNPALVNKDTISNGNSSYYYIDSVVVKLAKRLNINFTDTTLCAGDTIRVPYTVNDTGFFQSNNQIRLQLSNASGSFANPLTIGTKTSKQSDTIVGIIPTTITAGTGYRLRITSTNGADTSLDNGKNIGIGTVVPVKPVANNNGPLCANDTLKLTASTTTTGVSYRWTGPNNFTSNLQNPSKANPLPADSGNYIVTAYIYGCESKDTTTAVVFAGTGPSGTTATTNAPVCAEDTLKLFGTANGTINSYSWTGPGSFTSNTQNPVLSMATATMSGDYVLYASNGACTSRDTVTVVVKPRPANFSGTSNSPVCTGETLNFTASSTSTGVTYAWTGPGGFNSTSATPFINGATAAQNGDYYVTGTLNGCPLRDTVTVVVKPLPVKPVAGVNTPICAGETLNFTATTSTTGVSWSWTGPGSYTSTSQNPSITSTTTAMSGDYIVSAILNGCSLTDTATALVKPMPVPVSANSNSPVCAGDTLHIAIGTSTTGVSYSWAGPNSFSANTQNTFVANSTTAASGWYVATVNLNGCLYKDSTQATVHPIPATPSVSYSNPMCVGETLQLNASTVSGATYTWIGVGNYSANTQNPTRVNMQFGDTGTYSVTATANGCTSPAGSIKVNINPVPFVVILPTPGDSICVGEQATFTALPNNHGGTPTYQWRINGVPVGGNSTSYSSTTLNHSDVVRVDMTENTKCRANYVDASNEVEMKVLPWLAPSVSITATPNRPLNVDEYVTFTATVTNGGNFPKFQWKRNGQDVQGATGPVWSANTLNDNDSISVEIISNYRCPQPAGAQSNGIRVHVLTGVGDVHQQHNLSLYPNPNNGSFILSGKLNKSQSIQLDIINTIGQVVHSEMITANTGELNKEIQLSNVANGIYLLRLNINGETTAIRFRVER